MVIKTNVDSGQFGAIQHAASCALNEGDKYIDYIREVYNTRRKHAIPLLRSLGMEVFEPGGSFYVWFRVPGGYTSEEFSKKLLTDCGIIVTPGSAFGNQGKGYCRIALTVEMDVFSRAVERIKQSFFKYD
jgi:LL-diaminopimelate aminotransferase